MILVTEKYIYRSDMLLKSGVRKQADLGGLLQRKKCASYEVANKVIQKIHSEIF